MPAFAAARKLMGLTLPPISVKAWVYPPFIVGLTVAGGIALAWLPLPAAMLLAGGLIFLTLALINPTLCLYLLIPVIPFSSLLTVSPGGFRVGLMEGVLALMMLAWLLKILAGGSRGKSPLKIYGGPLLWPLLLFIGLVSLSWLTTFSIGGSLVETAKWVEMLALYLFIFNLLPANQLKWVVLVVLLTGLLQAGLGLYQFIFRVGPPGFELFEGRFLRAYGTFAQPNPYGGYLGLVLPLALSLAVWNLAQLLKPPGGLHQLKGAISARAYQIISLILVSLALVMMLAALFASQSRGAWVGFAAAALVTLSARSKKTAALLVALVLLLALIGLIGSFDVSLTPAGPVNQAYDNVIQRFAGAVAIVTITDVATAPVTDANFATLERLAHWQAAREMWQDNFWLGVGFGNYAVVYPAYAVGRWLDPLGHAHNYLLNIGAEAGLIGFLAYLIFWILTFGLLWKVVRRSRGFHQAVAAGALGIMVHLHIHNLVDNLYVQGMYLHIAIMLGLISVIYRHSQTSTQSREGHVGYF